MTCDVCGRVKDINIKRNWPMMIKDNIALIAYKCNLTIDKYE